MDEQCGSGIGSRAVTIAEMDQEIWRRWKPSMRMEECCEGLQTSEQIADGTGGKDNDGVVLLYLWNYVMEFWDILTQKGVLE